jgi:hypothetical protein
MKRLLPALVGLALLVPLPGAEACSFSENPVYVHRRHPDRPYEVFAEGRLGILGEQYRMMFLAYAYRSMMGIPTTADERRQVVTLWKRVAGDIPHGDKLDRVQDWLDARSEVAPSLPPTRPVIRGEMEYVQHTRINNDALLKAASTARALAGEWKAHPALVEEWVRNQDRVFGECTPISMPPLEPALDEGLTPAHRARRKAEHDYQRAASLFYCFEYDEALAAFQAISQAADTPYQALGAYLVARTRVRKAFHGLRRYTSLTEKIPEPEAVAELTEADRMLKRVMATRKWSKMHGPARRLRNLVRSHLEPEVLACELLSRVLQPGTGASLAPELGDLDLMSGWAERCTELPEPAAELNAWMLTLRRDWAPGTKEEVVRQQAYTAAVTRWKATGHLPWLVAALMKARPDSEGVAALLADVAKVPLSAPAGLTLTYHSAHLLHERGDLEASRALLDAVPPELTKNFVSTDNQLRSERFAVARSWDELFHNALRRLAGMDTDSHTDLVDIPLHERPLALGVDALPVLESRLTAKRLAELATGKVLTSPLRRWVGWTAFARAAVVGDDETLRAMAKALAAKEPAARGELLAIAARPTPEERQFEAQVLLMGLPMVSPRLEPEGVRLADDYPNLELTVDKEYEKNWWCAPRADAPVQPLPFVSAEEQQAAAAEWQALIQAGDSVPWFARVALDWAKAHPDDPRSPKALFRVVRASRRGCGQGTAEAKAAFDYLHTHYKKSPWAKKATKVY